MELDTFRDLIERHIDVAESDMRDAIKRLRDAETAREQHETQRDVFAAKVRRKALQDVLEEMPDDDDN